MVHRLTHAQRTREAALYQGERGKELARRLGAHTDGSGVTYIPRGGTAYSAATRGHIKVDRNGRYIG